MHAAVFESEEFETKIEEELLDMSFTEQKENLFEKRGCLFFSTGGCDCIFSDDFPLLKNTYYVLMCQLMHKYNISDWEGKRKNYLFR